jgi:hypothetical protein
VSRVPVWTRANRCVILKGISLDRKESDMSRQAPSWMDLKPVRVTALDARGPGLRGPTAMAAFAVGAAAFGALAIGQLAIGRAVIKRLVIEELEVGRLRVRELEVETERRPQKS